MKTLILLTCFYLILVRQVNDFGLSFWLHVQTCVPKVTQNIATKSPLRKNLVYTQGRLVCAKIIEDKKQCISQLRRSLSYLADAGHQTACSCDDVFRQYQDFIGIPSMLEALSEFDSSSLWLDVLLRDQLRLQRSLSSLWAVVRKSLLLSHDQAKRRFSVNREVVTENLSDQTLIALRSIRDYVQSISGWPEEVLISPGC